MVMSPRFIKETLRQRSEDTEVLLITISHGTWDEDIRLCSINKDLMMIDETTGRPVMGIESRGKKYLYAGIQPILPTSQDEAPPEASFRFSNVGREISAKLKIVDKEYPRICLELVSMLEPDFVEISYPEMRVNSASWNKEEGTITIINDIASNEPSPPHRFTKSSFPNLFME